MTGEPCPAADGDAAEASASSFVEWPTLALAFGIYGGWLALTFFHDALPYWLVFPVLAWLVAWQSSLQHEVLHGHPTRLRAVNDSIGFPPLSLWLPYHVYRRLHLRHHDDTRLTDPLDDPESNYWTITAFHSLGPIGRWMVAAQGSLLGRLMVGPAWRIPRFLMFQFISVWHNEPRQCRIWTGHLLGVTAVVAWLWLVCGFDLIAYGFLVVYPAMSLALIRSFAEHRAAMAVPERIAVVEDAPLFGLLFLHNNLHSVHHAWPRVPWYRIPQLYRRHREQLLRENGGLLYRGYWDVARRYLLKPHDRVIHPYLGAAPAQTPTGADTAHVAAY